MQGGLHKTDNSSSSLNADTNNDDLKDETDRIQENYPVYDNDNLSGYNVQLSDGDVPTDSVNSAPVEEPCKFKANLTMCNITVFPNDTNQGTTEIPTIEEDSNKSQVLRGLPTNFRDRTFMQQS